MITVHVFLYATLNNQAIHFKEQVYIEHSYKIGTIFFIPYMHNKNRISWPLLFE